MLSAEGAAEASSGSSSSISSRERSREALDLALKQRNAQVH